MKNQLKSILYLVVSVTLIVKVIGPAFDSYFPVVSTISITSHKPYKGFLDKVRNCTFVQSYAKVWTDGFFEIKEIRYLETPQRIHNRPLGLQKFGPWLIDIPDDALRVSFVFEHSCSPFWRHTQKEFVIYERITQRDTQQ